MAKSPYEVAQTDTIRLYITQEDVQEAERYGVVNPVIYALQQATRTLWRISDCGVALEVTPPYRSCVINSEVLETLQVYHATGSMPEIEFEVEFTSGSGANDSL